MAEVVLRYHKIDNNLHIIKRQKILKYTLQNTQIHQELWIRALCMQSVEPWRAAVPVVRALQLPIFAPNHDYNDEDDEEENDEVENDDDEYDDQMRALQHPIFAPSQPRP